MLTKTPCRIKKEFIHRMTAKQGWAQCVGKPLRILIQYRADNRLLATVRSPESFGVGNQSWVAVVR